MSKKGTDQLFKLIQSLTKQEKRNFTMFASRHTLGDQNVSVKLFDEIEKMKEYDETYLLKKYRKETFVNNFSITKNRLYEQVLRSLDAFHYNSSVEAQLRKDLHCAEILYKKTLYDQCARLLNSARKLAIRFEKFAILAEVHKMEKDLVEKDSYSDMKENMIEAIHEEDEQVAENIRIFNAFWNIKSRLFMLLNKRGKVRNKLELSDFKKIIDNTLLREKNKKLSVNARYLFNHIYSAYHFGVGDYKKCYNFLEANIDLIELYTDIFRDEPNVYFSLLTNIIYVGSQLKRYEDVITHLRKLREMPEKLATTRNEDLDIKLFSSAFSLEITLYNNTGDFKKAIALVAKIEEGLKQYEGRLSKLREAYFYFNIATAFFGAGNYSLALKWINRLLNDTGIAQNEYIHCMAQIFNLIIHIELKNNDLLAYAVKSTHRYLKSRNRAYKFETVFLQFTEIITKVNGEAALLKAFESLNRQLKVLSKDAFEKTAFEYFDVTAWVESKVTNQSFREVVQRKAL